VRKTNPISRLRILDCGLGTDLRRDAPRGLSPRPRAGQSCKTNPIPRLRIADWEQTCGGMPALPPATSALRRPIVQNEPNFAGGPEPGRSKMRETNPIRGANRAKRSQFAPCSRGRERSRGPIMQNKAKLGQDGTSGGRRLGEAECAKRTQFQAGPGGPGPQGARDVGESCKTNPISESRPAGGMPTIPLFHRSSIPIFVVHPSQQWRCGRLDGVNLGSILSGDSIR
jgi:hypothetical protein